MTANSTAILDDESTRGPTSDVGPTSTTCPECDGRVRPDGTDRVCEDCGLVVGSDRLDRGPEWREFGDERDDPRRVGAPLTDQRHDRGLSTEIGSGRDGTGKPINGALKGKWARVRKQHNRTKIGSKAERNQIYANTIVKRVGGALDLGDDVCDDACRLFRQAQGANLVQGRSIEAITGAALYIAARRTSGILVPVRTLADHVAEVDTQTVINRGQMLARELGLPIPPTTPVEHVPRLASALDVSDAERERAIRLADEAMDAGITGGVSPSAFAAACLYRVCSDVIQADAADAADVCPVTIRNNHARINDADLDADPANVFPSAHT